jgi:hypothetical protein
VSTAGFEDGAAAPPMPELCRVTGAVLGVLGGSGGVGASTFAAVLALCAGRSVLIDLDRVGGGIDVLLGIESSPGARWSGLRLGGGRLDPAALAEGLPAWRGVPVLAADTGPPSPGAVAAVLDAARACGTVVVALPRERSPLRDEALAGCLLTVLLVRGDVGGVTAAGAVASETGDASLGAVVWERELSGAEATDLIGLPLLGAARLQRRGLVLRSRLPRGVLRLARGVIEGAT